MVDIHSHILAGVDDGAGSLDESVKMLRIAARGGTTDIVATPHANLEYSFDPDQCRRKIAELAEAAGPQPRIHHGCDFHLSYENIQRALAEPSRFTINGRCYLLVEFPDVLIFKSTGEIFDLLMGAGMVPVVTHPERNYLLHQRLNELESWVERGCLIQVTAQSFLGRFGRQAKEFADLLVRRGLAHLVASDAHDAEDRTPDLSGAFAYLSKKFGAEVATRLLETNPRRVLEGAPVETVSVAAAGSGRKWYRFWRSD
jgi:protein-tyrosine phosphatase